MTGRILTTGAPAYAVVARVCPETPAGDYASVAFTAPVDAKTGAFSIDIKNHHTSAAHLEMSALRVDGSCVRTTTISQCFPAGKPVNSEQFNLDWIFAEAREKYARGDLFGTLTEVGKIKTSHLENTAAQKKAAAWKLALAPASSAKSPASYGNSLKKVCLSRCRADAETSGYAGAPASHNLVADKTTGPIAQIGAKNPEGFLFTWAPGRFVFDLGGKWKKLTGCYGVQKGNMGTIGLTILGDGRVLFSGQNTGGYWGIQNALEFSADTTGVEKLELFVTDGGDGNGGDLAVIADPVLTR